MNRRLLAGALSVSFFFAGAQAYAQSDEDKLRDQLRQAVLQLRELQDSQAMLQAAKTAAEQERDALKSQLAAAQVELQKARHGSSETGALQQSLTKMKDAYTQASGDIQQAQADRDKAQAVAAGTGALLDECQARNAELIKTAEEILDAYQNVGLVDVLAVREPFIGLKRVELQNAAQDYADHIHDEKLDPRTMHDPVPPKSNR